VDETARQAWESGRLFYVVTLNLGGTVADWTSMSVADGDDVAGALQTIEAVGLRLDSTGSCIGRSGSDRTCSPTRSR
jgi:hypothetical protein